MEKRESSKTVIQKLLDTMHDTVTEYDPTVPAPPSKVSDLIQGTAFFPGGTGLWRGSERFGKLPEYFPNGPVMLVGHNFDSIDAFKRSRENGGEVKGQFWQKLRSILDAAGLQPEKCFFTNALMGFKPGSATGRMPGGRQYREQCRRFLRKQVEIVRPTAVIALGNDAHSFVSQGGERFVRILHPSAWELRPADNRSARIQE